MCARLRIAASVQPPRVVWSCHQTQGKERHPGPEIGGTTQIGAEGYLTWAAAWPRVLTPSLARMAETWWSTVFVERKRRSAISPLVRPAATMARIWLSRSAMLELWSRVVARG